MTEYEQGFDNAMRVVKAMINAGLDAETIVGVIDTAYLRIEEEE